jgi:hypothetical protein
MASRRTMAVGQRTSAAPGDLGRLLKPCGRAMRPTASTLHAQLVHMGTLASRIAHAPCQFTHRTLRLLWRTRVAGPSARCCHAQSIARRRGSQPLTRILFVMDCQQQHERVLGQRAEDRHRAQTAAESAEGARTGQPGRGTRACASTATRRAFQPGKQDCDDTRLEVPFGPQQHPRAIRNTMQAVRCLGTTPIARSLEKAAKRFPGD